MGIITDIKKQKNKDRVSVFIDLEFVCGIEAITAARHSLKVGGEFSPEELNKIALESNLETAFNKAVRFLSYRLRSEKEVRDYLLKKEYSIETVRQVLKKLKESNYIDDTLFAEEVVKTYQNRYGRLYICSRLREKGIKKEIIDSVLGCDSSGAEEVAKKFLESHRRMVLGDSGVEGSSSLEDSDFGGMGHCRRVKQKLYALLFSKGFSSEAISAAISSLKDF